MTCLSGTVGTGVIFVGAALTTLALLPQAPVAGRDGFASVPGARLFYTDTGGTGVPVVLLHAATGHTSCRVVKEQPPIVSMCETPDSLDVTDPSSELEDSRVRSTLSTCSGS